jgi:hypothetical protein
MHHTNLCNQPSVVVHTYNVSTQEAEPGRSQVQSHPGLREILSQKNKNLKIWKEREGEKERKKENLYICI